MSNIEITPAFMEWLALTSWECENQESANWEPPRPCGWTNYNYRLTCKGCGAPHPHAEVVKSIALEAGWVVTEWGDLEAGGSEGP